MPASKKKTSKKKASKKTSKKVAKKTARRGKGGGRATRARGGSTDGMEEGGDESIDGSSSPAQPDDGEPVAPGMTLSVPVTLTEAHVKAMQNEFATDKPTKGQVREFISDAIDDALEEAETEMLGATTHKQTALPVSENP